LDPRPKKGSQFKFQEKDKIHFQSDVSAEYICQYINARLGIPKIIPPEPSYEKQYLMVALSGIVILWTLYRNRKNEKLWMVLALVVPWFTYTGTFFNLNMGTPFVYTQPSNKQLVIIWPSQQMQTILEGLLVASLIVTIGVCFGLMATWVPYLPYSRRRYSFWLFMILIGLLLYLFWRIWTVKSSWYLVYS